MPIGTCPGAAALDFVAHFVIHGFAFGVLMMLDTDRHPRADVEHLFAGFPGPDRRVHGTGEDGDLFQQLRHARRIAQGLEGDAKAHPRKPRVERIDDVQGFDLRQQILGELLVKLDAVHEAGAPAFRGIDRCPQHAGTIELVIIAMIEVPGRIAREQPAIHLDEPLHAIGIVGGNIMHIDHTLGLVAGSARRRPGRVILQRPKHLAQGNLHRARRLHVFEHDHAAILEYLVELLADRRIFHILAGDAADSRAEAQIVLQGAHRYGTHFKPSPRESPHPRRLSVILSACRKSTKTNVSGRDGTDANLALA